MTRLHRIALARWRRRDPRRSYEHCMAYIRAQLAEPWAELVASYGTSLRYGNSQYLQPTNFRDTPP